MKRFLLLYKGPATPPNAGEWLHLRKREKRASERSAFCASSQVNGVGARDYDASILSAQTLCSELAISGSNRRLDMGEIEDAFFFGEKGDQLVEAWTLGT